MLYRYIGEYPEGQSSATFWDVLFEGLEASEVPDDKELRFSTHRFFEPVTGTIENANGYAGRTREEMRLLAEGFGIEVDGRWGAKRIGEEIEAVAANIPEGQA